jgi:hypothetical protein
LDVIGAVSNWSRLSSAPLDSKTLSSPMASSPRGS